MDTSKKINFWKISTAALLVSLILVLIFQISYAWTNPTQNPSLGAGAISVSGGKVGIGTTNPGELLELHAATGVAEAGLRTSWTETGSFGEWNAYQGSTYMGGLGIFGSNYTTSDWRNALVLTAANNDLGSIQFRTKTSGSYNSRMIITNAGNVGIGTTTPDSILTVSPAAGGTINIRSLAAPSTDDNVVMRLQFSHQNGGALGYLQAGYDTDSTNPFTQYTNMGLMVTQANSNLIFGTNNTEQMRINEFGRVGINQTAPDPNYKLTIGSQAVADSGAKIETTSATNPAIYAANAGGGAAIQVDSGKGAIKALGGLVIENRTSDPASPVTGQIWLRTDL